MHRQLPPFSAVRAFEACGRHLSFKKAASELCLTQSAISHQIKALEDYLGIQLFYRDANGVSLTDKGSNYLNGIGDVLDRMAAETARVRSRDTAGSLSVRAAPGFVRWLLPRLSRFQSCWPDIDLNLSGSLAAADFASEDVDVNIQWGYVPQAGHSVTPLMASSRHPVISPSLLESDAAPDKPEDLTRFKLLHEGGCDNFEKWFCFAGVPFTTLRRGLNFANYDHVITAAVEGQGVALGYDVIVEDEVQSGRLIRLFDVPFPDRIMYSLVTPSSWLERPRIRAFHTWLINETSALPKANKLSALATAADISVHARP